MLITGMSHYPNCTNAIRIVKLERDLKIQQQRAHREHLKVFTIQDQLDRARAQVPREPEKQVRPTPSSQSQVRGLPQEGETRAVVRQSDDPQGDPSTKRTHIDKHGRIQRS
jgi:hypothetical protein